MATLRAVRVRDYRSFMEAELELRPLTLLYGENGVGKSALLRLVPAIYDTCLPGARHGLDLQSPALGGAGLKALRIHDTLVAPGVLRIELVLATKAGELVASYSFTTLDDKTPARISWLEVSGSCQPAVSLRWMPEELASTRDHYELRTPGYPRVRAPQRFEGLRPVGLGEDAPALLQALSEALGKLQMGARSRCLWLSAHRYELPRQMEHQALDALTLDHEGKRAAQLLNQCADLRRDVSRWFESFANQVLEIDQIGFDRRIFTLVLQAKQDTARRMAMGEGGVWLSQLLPVLTGLAMVGQRTRFGLDVMAIERPESHLHVARHEALGHELISAIKREGPKPTLLVETHSRPLLLSALLHVAQGVLSPDDVAVHWLTMREDGSSQVRRAQVHGDGSLSGLPASAFAPTRELEQRLARAQEGAVAHSEGASCA